jgi:cellulose 1,4-beta-cellobiosidase
MLAVLLSFAISALPGTAEVHPKITWKTCTKLGCTPQDGSVVIDSEWRDVVDSTGKPCVNGRYEWDSSICSGATDCSKKCYLNGYDYKKASVSTTGDAVRLGFVNPDNSVGSRIYLFDEPGGKYVIFRPLNKEITFDINTATLGCGTNGAFYWSEMDADGGMGRFPNNRAGAKYGTGYCDAQCPKDGKFVGDYANVGKTYGSCCYEFDVWEANKEATQFASHPCSGVSGPAVVCTSDCQKCDTSGCAWNHFYKGDKTYYGPGKTVDTTKKITVVTQFVTTTGTDAGTLKEVRRLYVQGGKVIQNNKRTEWVGSGNKDYDAMSEEYCEKFSYDADYVAKGGHASFSLSFRRGLVLCMSLWTDGSMWWLDSGEKGPCGNGGGVDTVKAQNRNSYVEYSNIRFGDLDSTY